MGGATRTGGDQGGAVAGEAGDAVDARGLKGFGEGHGRQHGGESPGQPRLPRPRRAEHEHMMGRTPAFALVSPIIWKRIPRRDFELSQVWNRPVDQVMTAPPA